MKKFISVLLAFSIIISCAAASAFATDKRTDCGEDCGYYPTILIPGLGQSNVWVTDDEGNILYNDDGKAIAAFPAYIQLPEVIKTVIGPLLLSLITQRDMGLSEAVADAIEACFEINKCDNSGRINTNVYLEKYPYSLEECSDYERNEVYVHVPLNRHETHFPNSHLYYFNYNSFDNILDITAELYEFIQMVKVQTGHSKVNIVPISQGGAVSNALLEYHPQVMDELHKVIYIVPALDGSTIVGDVFNDRIRFLDKDVLYNGFLATFFDKETSSMIETLVRILPDEVIMSALEAAANTLVSDIMIKSTNLWALCPSRDYPSAAKRHLSNPELAEIKRQTDMYYQAQLNSDKNIQKLLDKGVQVFNVAEYNVQMYGVGESFDIENADGIIQLDSTSMGAYAANIGETLPEGYKQKNTHCSNPEHNHISPDNVVDASAGLLPDTTFYFKNQKHEITAENDKILQLALRLLENDNIKDVYSSPDFPQFTTVVPKEADDSSSFFIDLSSWLYKNYGTNGFSEMLPITFNLIFKGLSDKFNEYILEPLNNLL